MENLNKNNPTQGWTEDEKYDFCKMENKWVKELTKSGKRLVLLVQQMTRYLQVLKKLMLLSRMIFYNGKKTGNIFAIYVITQHIMRDI